ncbi:hypothetical protein SGL43_07291 [Streptomyces globisporus]|uniref:Uncharacterized protein n=1 Tax=Streptomyces globisporus TaxID=1908 RepID=A0ABN8VCN4_STRGL|nr:hypothetical protein SGL43_07291 [Streptomyces globisporus]
MSKPGTESLREPTSPDGSLPSCAPTTPVHRPLCAVPTRPSGQKPTSRPRRSREQCSDPVDWRGKAYLPE